MRHKISYLFLLAVFFCFTTVGAQIIQEQVIPGELPDPSIVVVDGTYYASGSSNDWGPIFPIYKSTDLKNWTFVTYVFKQKPELTISNYWAPELFYLDGKFYCYYTAKRTDGTSMIGVATTKNIENGFKDEGPLLEWGKEAIDAFVYKENNTLFITWKAYGLNPEKPIQILGSELSNDGLSLKGESFNVLTADDNSWEKGGIEGQCIIEKDGYLYMLYSGNGCCGGGCDYQVGVARAKSMRGSWEKMKTNPLLKSNENWKCPGHGTALKTKGKWFYLYHAYPAKGFPYIGRSPILSQINWNETTGWPFFKEDANFDPSKILKENIHDDFSSKELENWWLYDIASYSFYAKTKKGKLLLTEKEPNKKNAAGAVIGVNPRSANFTISTKVTEKSQALKGLTVYATKDNSLGFGIKGSELILWKVKDGNFIILNQLTLEKAKYIFLMGEISNGYIATFKYSFNGTNWMRIQNTMENLSKVIGDNLSWWSWGIKAGLFVKSDSESGANQGVFDEFSIQYP